jgi:hypothetical protein
MLPRGYDRFSSGRGSAMRKLTVKNFSVIKDAELEFGKITVLIGPQSSGKSLLCKLAYFLGREILMKAEVWAKEGFDLSVFKDAVRKDFENWFPRSGWGKENWSVSFVSNGYHVILSGNGETAATLSLSFDDEFGQVYANILTNTYPDSLYSPAYHMRALAGIGVWDRTTYIPSERTYFVDTGKGYRSLATDPDPLTKAFALIYESSRTPDIKKPRMRRYLKGDLIRGEDTWLFAFDDGRILPLSELSSGNKELLPLFSVLEMYEFQRPSSVIMSETRFDSSSQSALNFDDFFIEEPEGHIFPNMQQELVRYFAELANSKHLRIHFSITTHSPYILSAFNNLIKAGMVGAESAKHHAAVGKVIPEKYWIKEGDFAAYKIEGGKLESIFDKKTGQIDGDYLDDVSGKISEEFGQLLEIQYGR